MLLTINSVQIFLPPVRTAHSSHAHFLRGPKGQTDLHGRKWTGPTDKRSHNSSLGGPCPLKSVVCPCQSILVRKSFGPAILSLTTSFASLSNLMPLKMGMRILPSAV